MDKGTVLVIDDEDKLRSLLKRVISLEGFRVLEAVDLKTGLKQLEKEKIDVVLCDVRLPDGNGVEFTKLVKAKFSAVEVIVLTAFGNIRDGVEAMQNGAFNYITKGDDNGRIIPLLNEAIEKKRNAGQTSSTRKGPVKYEFDSIIGSSPLLKKSIELAIAVANNPTTVLLLGETGTGKEVFANAIHNASGRAAFRFVALNCASFSKELMESEIFGFKSGAFTNANRDKNGLIEEANKGTLFLDEIGELPYDLQSKLLRVLETGEYIKMGDTKNTRVDVRIITATNRDLKNEVFEGRFREDLFYRLNVYPISLPSLRERKKDIPALARNFIQQFAKNADRIPGMSAPFIDKLTEYAWPGNIRELRNCIERAMILSNGADLDLKDLPVEIRRAARSNQTLSAFDLSSIEKLHIQRVLIHTQYNKAEAARLLNIGLATLYRKIDEYQL